MPYEKMSSLTLLALGVPYTLCKHTHTHTSSGMFVGISPPQIHRLFFENSLNVRADPQAATSLSNICFV